MIRAARKQFGFDNDAVIEPHFLDVATARIIDSGNKSDYTCNAADLCVPDAVARPLLSAVVRLYDGNKNRAKNVWSHLKRFCEFLRDESQIVRVDEIDRGVMEQYRLHLRRLAKDKALASKTIFTRFRTAQSIVAEALRVRGIVLREIDNPFPGIGRAGEAKAHLSKADLIRVISAAKREAVKIWLDFTAASRIPPDSALGRAMTHIKERHGGIVPANITRLDPEINQFTRRDIPVEHLARRLHATRDSLLPFVLLIGYSTAANICSLAEMRRNCMSPGLLPDSFEIRWFKNRATAEQIVVRSGTGQFSAPVLIGQVLEFTQPLVGQARKREQDFLFITRGSGHCGAVGRMSPAMWGPALKAFLKRNKLYADDGSLLRFTLDMVRPTVLAETYRNTRNIAAVQRFANHRYLETTVRYVVDRVTEEMHDAAIARSQGKLYAVIMAEKTKDDRGPDALSPTGSRGIAGDCADIYAGPSGKGECPAWLWPLNDPALVVPADPQPIAELIRLRQALKAARPLMNPDAFRLRFGTVSATVAGILKCFPRDLTEEAERIACGLPALPSVANE